MKAINHKDRLLIENLSDAYAYHQLVTESEGKPVDDIFLEVNPAFEKMTGLEREKIISKKVTAQDQQVGTIEMCYLEHPDQDQGREPFLKEEKIMLHMLAENLGQVIERNRLEREQGNIFELSKDMIGCADIVEDWNDNMGHAQVIYMNPQTGFLEGGRTPVVMLPLPSTNRLLEF